MTTWMGTPKEERTFDNLLQRLLAEESIIKPERANETVAMKMSTDRNKPNSRAGNKKTIECYHCGKVGHMKRNCRALKKEQGNEAKSGDTKSGEDKKRFAIMAKTGSANSSGRWLVDSGASEHMTADRNLLDDYQVLDSKVPICVGNNEYVYGIGAGSVKIISTVDDEEIEVTIKNVLHVPGISDNLFSAGVADSRGLKISMSQGRMDIICRGKVIMVGYKTDGSNLYQLNVKVPLRACVARSERTDDEWHRVLGHPGMDVVRNLQRTGCTSGFKIVDHSRAIEGCGGCPPGKAHQVPHPTSSRPRATSILERVHVDLVGKINPSSLGGAQHFLLIRDEFSTYMFVYFIASKAQVPDMIQMFINEASVATQKRVRVIRSDNGSEFRNIAMTQICQAEGIVQEYSSPYTPMQNGEIERANRSVIESARAMLLESGLPDRLWGEAINTAVYLKNRLTNKRTANQTPYELFHGRAPDYSHLIEFGQQVHVLDKGSNLSKFQQKTVEAFMVGYTERVNSYRCYSPIKRDVFISSDVFVAPHKTKTNLAQNCGVTLFTIDGFEERTQNSMAPSDEHSRNDEDCAFSEQEPIYQEAPVSSNEDRANIRDDVVYANQVEPAQTERATNQREDHTGSTNIYVNDVETAQAERASRTAIPNQARLYPSLDTEMPMRPDTARGDTAGNNAGDASRAAFRARAAEIRAQLADFENRARTSCVPASNNQPTARGPVSVQSTRQPPVVMSPIAGASRQTGALSPRSLINRLRPTLSAVVGKDNTRTENVTRRNLVAAVEMEPKSFDEALSCADKDKWKIAICEELAAHADNGTWELVPKQAHMREITAKWIFKIKDDAVNKRYKARLVARGFSQQEGTDYDDIFAPVVRMDSVRLLFSLAAQLELKWKQFDITTAFLNGEVNEELYLTPPEGLNVPTTVTCRLRRSLYGLKQAPRCWNAKFTEKLSQFGMQKTSSDSCVYVSRGEPTIYLALYVDDGLVFARDERSIDRLLDYLKGQFKVKVINSACFLGLEIMKNEDGSIFLHQERYIKRVLQKFNMTDCKSKPTPIVAGHAYNRPETLKESVVQGVPYAELLGSLLYCSVATRPDISYTLSVLSKYMSEPREAHWEGLKRTLRYLSGTQTFGLRFARRENPAVECFTDADYAGDHQNRRSTSGMIAFLASGPISYRAQQQSTTAMSTTEAEYIASVLSAKELVWLRAFLKELKVDLKREPEMLCDNQSSIRLIKNPEFHQRTKHIDIAYHFVREKYEEGLFALRYVSTEDQKADIFTKALATNRFQELRDAIGCVRSEVKGS